MVKQKLTQLEWIIIAGFSGMALASYLSVFVAQIISEFYGYDYMSQTSALLFLIVATLNVLIVVQMVKLFIFHKSTQNLSGFGLLSQTRLIGIKRNKISHL